MQKPHQPHRVNGIFHPKNISRIKWLGWASIVSQNAVCVRFSDESINEIYDLSIPEGASQRGSQPNRNQECIAWPDYKQLRETLETFNFLRESFCWHAIQTHQKIVTETSVNESSSVALNLRNLRQSPLSISGRIYRFLTWRRASFINYRVGVSA